MRRAVLAYLPADQGQLLVQAANMIAALHQECQEIELRKEAYLKQQDIIAAQTPTTTRK